MGKKIKDRPSEGVSITRIGAGALEQVLLNNSRGRFYYCDAEGVQYIDNSKGKMVRQNFKTLEEFVAKICQ